MANCSLVPSRPRRNIKYDVTVELNEKIRAIFRLLTLSLDNSVKAWGQGWANSRFNCAFAIRNDHSKQTLLTVCYVEWTL